MSFDEALDVAPREVALVDERDAHPVRGRRLRDAGADDPAADHEQVEAPRGELL